MDAERELEIKRARDAIQMIETIQSMIDVSADRLEGLRTQCSTSAELTQQEIRTLEGKLVKHFSRQLVNKSKFNAEIQRELKDVPSLSQWLRVVGLSQESIESICSRMSSLEALRERSEHELRALLSGARDEEVKRLCRAMNRLKSYTEALGRGDGADSGAELPLYWDSWERHARASPRPRRANDAHSTPHNKRGGKSPTTPVCKRDTSATLPAPASLTKCRSHDSQLSVRADGADLSDNSQSSAVGADSSPPASPPPAHNNKHNNTNSLTNNCCGAPVSPRTPLGRCMAHDIAHRFTRSFNMLATCDYCDKQMLFGSQLKCKECKFKCHSHCESKVPPSCGLPPEFVNAFKEKIHKDGGYVVGSPVSRGILGALAPRRRPAPHNTCLSVSGAAESSSNSSCNSSAPSSPAPPHPTPTRHHHHFHFPEVRPAATGAASVAASPARRTDTKEETGANSEGSAAVSLSGSGSTDSAHADVTPADTRWPRQNSLSMKEWDIPYEQLKLLEVIGAGRFGTVYRGNWYGPVAVKLLHVNSLTDDCVPPKLHTFKHEVATFRKTRHENLVLFMGACMKPPRLCIVTSLCSGNTLHTHIHLRRDKFTPNKSVRVAQQISQGMGYLHARGILHKDLKTKNIFLENGKVVITDFGLFSVTKLCFGNNARGDSLGIPGGWLCYLAPELTRALTPHASLHLPFSKATDVYAFGTVWYELLCGEFPFTEQPPEAIIWQVGKGVKQSLANMQASRDIKDILMLCWSYKASDRPDFPRLLSTLEKLPRKRLARSPSHPVHLSRSADSVF